MRARDDARAGALFAAAGLAAGGGHYLFQVFASRALDAATFAEFSGWLAHLSVAFVTGGVVQYLANFHPVPRARLGRWMIAINAFVLVPAIVVARTDAFGAVSLVAVVALAAAQGWLFGQVQIRLDFSGLALAQIVNAAGKLALPLITGPQAGRGFAQGLAWGFLPSVWWLTLRLWRAPDPPPTARARAWLAPVMLAVAANVFPQFDLLVTRHALTAVDFATFARASLFYKGIYFAVFIFAQWLLPRQIRGAGRLGPALAGVAAFAGVATLGLTAVASTLARVVFAWDQAPPAALILGSCAHVSLLTLIFLIIQDECARARSRLALAILGGLAIEATVAISTGATLTSYVSAVLVAQTTLLAISWSPSLLRRT